MKIIELQLDEQIYEHAQKLAEARHYTLETLLKEMIEQLALPDPKDDPVLGMFVQDSTIIDELLESVMLSRETDFLRASYR